MGKKDLLVLVAASLFLLLAVPGGQYGLAVLYPYDFMPPGKFTLALGTVTSATGLLFTIWANYELYRVGRGGAAVIGRVKLMTETSKLVTTGPYALCRNPMHLGLILYYLGCSCALNSFVSLLLPAATLVAAMLFAMLFDEPRLKRDFGEEYEKWAENTPRFWPKVRKS